MTEEEIEGVIKKARRITFQDGVHSMFAEEVPGYIGLVFNNEYLFEVIDMYEYIKNKLPDFPKKIYIKQTKSDRVDFTLIVEREPAIILTVKDLECSPGRFEWFYKKEPKEKPISLLIIRNEAPDTIENMVIMAEASTKAGLYHPIQIHSWNGLPLGIS